MNLPLSDLINDKKNIKKLRDFVYVEQRDYRTIPKYSDIRYFDRKGNLRYAGTFVRFFESERPDDMRFLIKFYRLPNIYNFQPYFYRVFYRTPSLRSKLIQENREKKKKLYESNTVDTLTTKKSKSYRKILVNLKDI